MDIVILGCVVFVMDRPGIGHGRREGIVLEEIIMVDVVLIARLLCCKQNINSLCDLCIPRGSHSRLPAEMAAARSIERPGGPGAGGRYHVPYNT